MSSRRDFFKKALKGCTAAGAIALTGCGQKSDDGQSKYDYDLTNLKKVDAKWLTYDLKQSIEIDMDDPTALTSDGQDRLVLAGAGQGVIYNGDGAEVSRFTIEGKPRCIALGSDNRLYLGYTEHIEVFDAQGKRLARWDALDREAILTGLAVNDAACFAADAGNKLIHHYGLDGSYLGKIGKKDAGKDAPGFIIPSPYFDVTVGNYGELWATNTGRHFVSQYATDGRRVSHWGRASYRVDGFSGCCNPTHVAVLPDGRFVTSEKGLPRVKVYRPDGQLDAVVAGPNAFHDHTTGLDLAVLKQGVIAVLVPDEKQIRLYRPVNR